VLAHQSHTTPGNKPQTVLIQGGYLDHYLVSIPASSEIVTALGSAGPFTCGTTLNLQGHISPPPPVDGLVMHE
jgi:hypothetical protein